jgi:diguanylate cyclase (GGDEF)-like protein/PAS domain S-box-containing protein
MAMPSQTKKILLIQDDAPRAQAIVAALDSCSDLSFQTEWVRDCSQGLDRLAGAAAILVDLFLPDTQGIATFEHLFRAAPGIPILILTDLHDGPTARLAVQHGAQDYLFKDRLDSYLLPKALHSMIERAAIAEALFQENERALVTLNSIGDAVLSTDVIGRVTYLNVIAERLTGWAQDQAIGRPMEEVFRVVDASTRQIAPNPMIEAMQQNKTVSLTTECVLVRRDGAEAAIEDSCAPIHDRRGQVTGAVLVFHDVSAARAMTMRMAYLAQYDSLTELPNRVLMHDRLAEAIVLSNRNHRRVAVLFLDLDRFKHINDSLGHANGDLLLKSVARRLFTCVRSSDTVSRMGGDEFVILLWEERCAQDAGIVAGKILAALRQPHSIGQHVVQITASVGIVTYPDDGADAETLLQNADLAMYYAKSRGRDNYQFFASDMDMGMVEDGSAVVHSRLEIGAERAIPLHLPTLKAATGQ